MVQSLEQDLNKLCDEHAFHTGWYFKNLRTGDILQRHGDVVVPSASTRKIAIMMAALKAVNEGKLALDQPVVMEAKYQKNDSGCFQHLSSDFVIQLRDALSMMIIVSDNTCTGAVADRVGLEPINALCQSIGMSGTTHRYDIPPAGMAGYLPAEKTNANHPSRCGAAARSHLAGKPGRTGRRALGLHPRPVPVGD